MKQKKNLKLSGCKHSVKWATSDSSIAKVSKGRVIATGVGPAKNPSVTDYRRATGFEAVLGYLYLRKEWKRMLDLVKTGLKSLNEGETDE